MQGWSSALPWLYYANGIDACSDLQFSGRASLRWEYETYVVAVYQLDGTFKGFRPLNTFLTYCGEPAPYSGYGGGTSSSNAYTQFGSGEVNHYKCDLATLLAKPQEFYELYLADPRGAGNALYPAPVRVTNLRSKFVNPNNFQPKGMLCDSGDVLVRRFFLYDIVSGITASSGQYPQVAKPTPTPRSLITVLHRHRYHHLHLSSPSHHRHRHHLFLSSSPKFTSSDFTLCPEHLSDRGAEAGVGPPVPPPGAHIAVRRGQRAGGQQWSWIQRGVVYRVWVVHDGHDRVQHR